MKIAIGCIFYQCRTELERLVNSIPRNFIDYFIGIDGIYKYNKEQNPQLPDVSNDGSRELLMQYGGGQKYVVALSSKPNSTEFEKRNTYLEICDKLGDIDVLIIVDSDEFFLFPEGTNLKDSVFRFKRNLEFTIGKLINREHNVFGIHTLNLHDKVESYKPRIWYKPEEMRYLNGSHYHYANIKTEQATIETFNQNRINYCQHVAEVVKGAVLGHDHSLRSQKQTEMHDKYVEYLTRFEGLVQSHKYNIEEAHKFAVAGVSYDDILRNKIDKK